MLKWTIFCHFCKSVKKHADFKHIVFFSLPPVSFILITILLASSFFILMIEVDDKLSQVYFSFPSDQQGALVDSNIMLRFSFVACQKIILFLHRPSFACWTCIDWCSLDEYRLSFLPLTMIPQLIT